MLLLLEGKRHLLLYLDVDEAKCFEYNKEQEYLCQNELDLMFD